MNVGWIWSDNLRPLLEILSHAVAYAFDDSDWAAFEAGMADTDSERGPWFEFPVAGVLVRAALEPGAGEMTSIVVDGVDEATSERLAWTGALLRDYHLAHRQR